MHACVGAAGTGEFDGLIGNASEGRLQGFLDGGGVRLALPAMVGRPVVLNTDRNAAHGPGG